MAYLTRTQLINNYPVPSSRPGLRNWVKRNGFPKPFYANPNTPIWTDDVVAEWFATRPTNHYDAKKSSCILATKSPIDKRLNGETPHSSEDQSGDRK